MNLSKASISFDISALSGFLVLERSRSLMILKNYKIHSDKSNQET